MAAYGVWKFFKWLFLSSGTLLDTSFLNFGCYNTKLKKMRNLCDEKKKGRKNGGEN